MGELGPFGTRKMAGPETVGLPFESRAFEMIRAQLGPTLHPMIELGVPVPCAHFVAKSIRSNLPHSQKHMGMKIPVVVMCVRRVDRDIKDHALAGQFFSVIFDERQPLFGIQFVGQRYLEVAGELGLIGPSAPVFPQFDGVPEFVAISGPFRRVLGIEDAFPLGLAEMTVVIDLTGPLIDEPLTRVIRGAGNDVVAVAAFYNSHFEPIQRRSDSLPSRRHLRSERAKRATLGSAQCMVALSLIPPP
jgi:hypothetical protein